jgi:hypothetical protein
MYRIVLFSGLATAKLLLPAAADAAELDCRTAHWEGRAPSINVGHIFCGEIKRRPDGYHSEAIFPTPLVAGVSGRQEIGRGVYNGTVVFADGERKFSTFYPRTCTVEMVLRSIRYAVAQPATPKRGGWGFVAPSGPGNASREDGFCLGADGRPFTIRYGLLPRGDVNTAFPDGTAR